MLLKVWVHLDVRPERPAEARWRVLYAVVESIMEPQEGFGHGLGMLALV